MSKSKSDLVGDIRTLQGEALAFFRRCAEALARPGGHNDFEFEPRNYWPELSDELRAQSEPLIVGLVEIGHHVAAISKASPLVDSADLAEIPIEIKRMRSALRLKRYFFSGPDVIHDEGQVLGLRPASQGESGSLSPNAASNVFDTSSKSLLRILQLASDDATSGAVAGTVGSSDARRYKPNTAFIMMWMSPEHPQLEDVKNAVQDVFGSFGIRAVRADEIEHDGVITQRIVDEIKSAEFLFADLTGSRTNVYYEIGYAHALGKRVILFREADTGIHFDLAGYNCPEYSNMTDLKRLLTKRLAAVTNRDPISTPT